MSARNITRAGTSTYNGAHQARGLLGVQLLLFAVFGMYAVVELYFNYELTEALNGDPSVTDLAQLIDKGRLLAAFGMGLLCAGIGSRMTKNYVLIASAMFGVSGYHFGFWLQEAIATEVVQRLPDDFKERAAVAVASSPGEGGEAFAFVRSAIKGDSRSQLDGYADKEIAELAGIEANFFVAGLLATHDTSEKRAAYLKRQALLLGKEISLDRFQNERDFVAMTWFAYAAYVNPHPKYQKDIQRVLLDRYGMPDSRGLRAYFRSNWGSGHYNTAFACLADINAGRGCRRDYKERFRNSSLPMPLSIYGMRKKGEFREYATFEDLEMRTGKSYFSASLSTVFSEYTAGQNLVSKQERKLAASQADNDLFKSVVRDFGGIYSNYALGLKSLDIPTGTCREFYSHPEVKRMVSKWTRWMFLQKRDYFASASFCDEFDLESFYHYSGGREVGGKSVLPLSLLDSSMWNRHVVSNGFLFLPQESLWRYRESDLVREKGNLKQATAIGRGPKAEVRASRGFAPKYRLDLRYYLRAPEGGEARYRREGDGIMAAMKLYFPEREVKKLNGSNFRSARFSTISKIREEQLRRGIVWKEFEEHKLAGMNALGLDPEDFTAVSVKLQVRDSYASLVVGATIAFVFSVLLLVTAGTKAIIGVMFIKHFISSVTMNSLYVRLLHLLSTLVPCVVIVVAFWVGGDGLAGKFGLADSHELVVKALMVVGNIYEYLLEPIHRVIEAVLKMSI